MVRRFIFLGPLLFSSAIECFSPGRTSFAKPRTTTALNVINHELAQEMQAARGAFGLCFYGAFGVGSVGRELIPLVFGRYQSNQDASATSAKNERDTGKLTDLGIKGYPDAIYLEDVQSILANRMDAEAMAKKFKAEDVSGPRFEYTHIERAPFLTYEAFQLANPRARPIALRAVFDSFSDSIGGGNAISPVVAQQRIDMYREDVATMTQRLNRSKVLGVSAFAFLLVLLGFADWAAIYHLWRGFFPEWQGFSDMPASLVDGEIGISSLLKYFVWEIPDV